MPRQLWLADVLVGAGLTVVEVPGWRTRGRDDYRPQGLIIHETRGSRTSTDADDLHSLIHGRQGLAGPIAQLFLSRTGTWHVVTAGRSNHVKNGWGGPFRGLGNRRLLGVESQHATGERWTTVQYDSYVRGAAAILAHTGWPPPVGHREHQPGDKPDPAFDMDVFRRDVAAAMRGVRMSVLVRKTGEIKVFLADGITRRWVASPAELAAIRAAATAGHLILAAGGRVQDVASLDPYGRELTDPADAVRAALLDPAVIAAFAEGIRA
ncbi:hypothetical protein F4553_006683 [Allocatelliglobosispora scoriae]|uniref:N-acetylmuramoyl-L-alanine amidase domain-containing protein n=1 Tax=Allocatelliglobosispora scoriae TaxID=643052 RepID=A0A841C1P8_9ACTN|nr:N-acetylmuramoyl-L-alanine amidase [Allocatelliglobosispora scoriae]MBB5873249.1 hypothetical protein [Allocatelliglobosispora scoriae]